MFILLCCAAGMSTSLLVARMEEAAKRRGIDAEILAVSAEVVKDHIKNADVLLIGPQIRYKYAYFKKEYGNEIPVELINPTDYGTVNGEKVLDFALSLLT